MARLDDDRQDLYCSHRARGMLPAKAAIAAGYAAGSGITTRLEAMPEIAARISELMEEIATRREQQRTAALAAAKALGTNTGVTRAWILEQLVENAILARQDGDYVQSNQALKLLGDEFGMFKGGSSPEDLANFSGNKVIDLDATEAILGKAREVLLPNPTDAIKPEEALALLGTGSQSNHVHHKERQLTTGSETDIALSMPDEPPEDE